MNVNNVGNILNSAYQYTSKTQKTTASSTSFTESLQGAAKADTSNVDVYTKYLISKYGKVTIQSVGKDQASLDGIGKSMSGNDVIIAPNILEQMANDPEKAAYYEEKIQQHFDSIPETEAFMAAMGHVTTSAGVVIHEDGSVTYYLSGEEGPEKKAKFEAAQKEKREKKAEERRETIKRNEEIAAEQRRIAEEQYHAHLMEQMRNSQIYDSSVGIYIVGQTQPVTPTVSAYEKAISTMSISMIQGI